MSLDIIRPYATFHICQDHEQFTNDAIYRLLTEELSPLPLTHYPETAVVSPNEPIELIPGVLGSLRKKIKMKDGEEWEEVWDVPRKSVDLIVGVQKGLKRLKKTDRKLTDLRIGSDPFVRSVSPPPSPVMSRRALQETPNIGCLVTSDPQDPLSRQTKTFLQALDPIRSDEEFETSTSKLDLEDVLNLKLLLSEETAGHVKSLLGSLPEMNKHAERPQKRNPILESANDRASTLEFTMNPVWAQERSNRLAFEKESTRCMSPPIFPRRLDSVCYDSRDEAHSSTSLPTTLGQIGDRLVSTSEIVGLDSRQDLDKLKEDPFSMDALDEFMHVPVVPSDITFSPPSSDPELGAGFTWPMNLSMKSHATGQEEVNDLMEPPIFPRALELGAHRDHDDKKWPRSLSEVLSNLKSQSDETSPWNEFSSSPTPRSRTLNKFRLDVSEFDQELRPASSTASPSLAGQASPTEELTNPIKHNDMFALNSDDLVHELLGLLHEGDVSSLVGSTNGWLEELDLTIEQGHDVFPGPPLRPAKDCIPADLPITPSGLKDVVRLLSLVPSQSLAKPLEAVRLSGLTSLSVELSWRPFPTILRESEVMDLNDLHSKEDHVGWNLLIDSVEPLFSDSVHRDHSILSRTRLYPSDLLYLPPELDSFIYTRKEVELQRPDISDPALQAPDHKKEQVAEIAGLHTSDSIQLSSQATPLRHDKRPRLVDIDALRLADNIEKFTASQVSPLGASSTTSDSKSIIPDVSDLQVRDTSSSPRTLSADYTSAISTDVPSDTEVDDMFPVPKRLVDLHSSTQSSTLSPLSHFLSTRNKLPSDLEQALLPPPTRILNKLDEQPSSDHTQLESVPDETIKTPQNLAEFEAFSANSDTSVSDDEAIWYHCIGGQKLLQNRRVYRSLEKSSVLPHHRSHPSLSREASPSISIGLDLILSTLTAATIYPLQILPSILSQIPKLAEHLQSRYDHLYVILTIPADREAEVWTPLVKSSIGKARRAIAMQGLGLNEEEGLKVKIGWVREDDVGNLLRFLLESFSTVPSDMGSIGDSWLAPWEHTSDLDEASWEEMESSLANFNWMNPFSAAWVLALMNLDEFLDLSSSDRINSFGPLFGFNRMERQSDFIASRRLILPSEESITSLPPSSPPSNFDIPFEDHLQSDKQMIGHPRDLPYWQDSGLEEMGDILEEDGY